MTSATTLNYPSYYPFSIAPTVPQPTSLFGQLKASTDPSNNGSIVGHYLFRTSSLKTVAEYSVSGVKREFTKPSVGLGIARFGIKKGDGYVAGEAIFGVKPFAIGASIVKDNGQTSLSLIRRSQLSVLAQAKDIVRFSDSGVVQLVSRELSGASLVTSGTGEALNYVFSKADDQRALAILEKEGFDSAYTFIKKHYSHVDKTAYQKMLIAPVSGIQSFIAEGIVFLGLDIVLDQALSGPACTNMINGLRSLFHLQPIYPNPDSVEHIKKSISSGVSYAVANLMRESLSTTSALKIGFSIAEGIPMIGMQYLTNNLIDATLGKEEFTGRSIVESLGALFLYSGAKSILFGSLGLSPVGVTLMAVAAGAVYLSVNEEKNPQQKYSGNQTQKLLLAQNRNPQFNRFLPLRPSTYPYHNVTSFPRYRGNYASA